MLSIYAPQTQTKILASGKTVLKPRIKIVDEHTR